MFAERLPKSGRSAAYRNSIRRFSTCIRNWPTGWTHRFAPCWRVHTKCSSMPVRFASSFVTTINYNEFPYRFEPDVYERIEHSGGRGDDEQRLRRLVVRRPVQGKRLRISGLHENDVPESDFLFVRFERLKSENDNRFCLKPYPRRKCSSRGNYAQIVAVNRTNVRPCRRDCR